MHLILARGGGHLAGAGSIILVQMGVHKYAAAAGGLSYSSPRFRRVSVVTERENLGDNRDMQQSRCWVAGVDRVPLVDLVRGEFDRVLLAGDERRRGVRPDGLDTAPADDP
jgi:hypothetical protein